MAGMDELMKKYGLESPPKPEKKPETPEIEEPVPASIPEKKEPEEIKRGPIPGAFNGGRQEPEGAKRGPIPGAFNGGRQEPEGAKRGPIPGAFSGGRQEPEGAKRGPIPGAFNGGRQEPEGAKRGPIPGAFNGGRQEPEGAKRGPIPGTFEGGRKQDAAPVPRERRRSPVPAGGLRLWDRLPPLWGVDLCLIGVSIAGLVLIALNWTAVLLTIARVLFAIAGGVLNLGLFLGLGAAALFFLRRRRR